MSARTMIMGDTYPPLRGEASSEAGVLDLTAASSLQVRLRAPNPGGGFYLITGVPTADTPPVADADGIHFWNWHYNFQAGDTAHVGDYFVELVVTWSTGNVQTFSSGIILTIVEGETS